MSELKPIEIRLAFRAEGEYVNAYHAATNTMQGAVLLGSMRRSLLDDDRGLWLRWKQLLEDAYSGLVERSTGARPVMDETPAPEHERSGRG